MGGKKRRLNLGSLRGLARGQRGDTLVEILIAAAILGIVAVSFLGALVTAYHGVILADKQTMAESLTRAQLERVRDAEYPITDYDVTVGNYVAEVRTEYIDPYTYEKTGTPLGMQMITVTVMHDGDELLVTQTNKVNR